MRVFFFNAASVSFALAFKSTLYAPSHTMPARARARADARVCAISRPLFYHGFKSAERGAVLFDDIRRDDDCAPACAYASRR